MKLNQLLGLAITGIVSLSLLTAIPSAVAAKSIFEMAGSEAKYTPGDFKPAPDKMKTYDELDRQRATQLYLDMYPALSAHGLLKGWVRDYGIHDISDIVVTANRLDSNALILTGNTESLYSFFVLDLKANGPIVFEVPVGVMGPIDDHNFLFLADVGQGHGRQRPDPAPGL